MSRLLTSCSERIILILCRVVPVGGLGADLYVVCVCAGPHGAGLFGTLLEEIMHMGMHDCGCDDGELYQSDDDDGDIVDDDDDDDDFFDFDAADSDFFLSSGPFSEEAFGKCSSFTLQLF